MKTALFFINNSINKAGGILQMFMEIPALQSNNCSLTAKMEKGNQ